MRFFPTNKRELRSRAAVHVLPETVFYGLETWIAMHEDLRQVARVRATFQHLVRALKDYATQG